MNWYSQMIKSQETVRERNRREQRRFQLQLDEKHGPEFAAKYRVKELNREQRIVSKELERIRKGVHKPLAHEYMASSPTEKRAPVIVVDHKSTVGYTQEETSLYKAMLFLQNNPAALVPIISAHSQSQAYFDTLERISPNLTPQPRTSFVPNYLKTNKGTLDEDPLVTKYSALLYRQSPVLRKNSPFSRHRKSPVVSKNDLSHEANEQNNVSNSPSQLDDLQITGIQKVDDNLNSDETKHCAADTSWNVYEGNETEKCAERMANTSTFNHNPVLTEPINDNKQLNVALDFGELEDDVIDGSPRKTARSLDVTSVRSLKQEAISTSTPTSGRPPQRPDLLTLANGGVQSARDSVAQRLSDNTTSNTMATYNRKISVADRYSTADDMSYQNAINEDGKRLTATKAVSIFPSYDPEVYNADGSLRTVHNLPDFVQSYEQARKARYIRSKENLEKEKELSIKQIFDKK